MYYASDRQTRPHTLDLTMYGIDKVWVVIDKEGARNRTVWMKIVDIVSVSEVL